MNNKPDFIQIASDDESILHQDTFSGFVMGCEHVWSSHVEPLQKENEKLIQNSDFDHKEYLRLKLEFQSEITRLKESKWIKTAERLPTAEDSKRSEVIAWHAKHEELYVTHWMNVVDYPERHPYWQNFPEPPSLGPNQ